MKVLIAIAWPYVNGDLHVGHLAGYLLPADIFARFQRLLGRDVLMVSGSDCYGTPITVQADKERVTPSEIVEKYHKLDLALFRQYALSYNLYTKTATANHKEIAQELFLELLKNGVIKKGVMQQYYSVEDKKFFPDRYVEGMCPHCKAKDQRSDQCEACGRWLEDGELINPASKLTGSKVVLKDTEHYFLSFKSVGKELEEFVTARKDEWKKWVWAETQGWLKEGLRDRAITRDLDWGIDLPIEEIKKFPKEKQLEDFEGKKIYVWLEAVMGYLSGAIEWSRRVSGDIKDDISEVIFNKYEKQSRSWRDFWLNKKAEHYYFMGQDNLVFHTLLWPAMLIGSKRGYTLPKNVVVNKFMNYEGKKFSKSRNWTIDSKKIAEIYGVDPVRYYMASNLPENKEANFTWDSFISSVNNELVGNLGNFIHRVLTFVEKNFRSEVPEGELSNEVRFEIRDTLSDSGELIQKVRLVEGLSRIMKFVAFANRYFDKEAVWKVVKDDRKKAGEILYNCLQIIQALSVLLYPYMPDSSIRLANMLQIPEAKVETGKNNWRYREIKPGHKIGKIEVIYKKLDPEEVEANKSKLGTKVS
ncbi:MAG: methionine--tRNA ligase [Patescibacteria group bacterium]|nr:methionine--tRNA ligase [Patescibacteria group bacterium]